MSTFRTDVVQHLGILKARAQSLTKNSSSADDLVQDTIIRAFRFEHKYEPDNLKSWLLRVMTNIFLSQYRKSSKIEKKFVDPGEEGLDWLMPEKPAIINESHLDIVEALKSVPKEQAELLILAEVEGLSYKEIAEKLNVPIGTVMSRLFRAREKLGTNYGSL